LHPLESLSAKLGQILALYGGWGLFGTSFLDSSFVPLPVLNDLLLMHLSSQHRGRAVIYALQATLGSLLGSYALYGVGRGGISFFWRKSSPEAVLRARRWLDRNDFVVLVVASLLPPPTPYKVFLLTAGVLRVNVLHFGMALLVGRGLRFGALALLGACYGAQAEAYLKQNAGWASLVAAVLVVGLALLYRRLRRRWAAASTTAATRSGPSAPR
jgi:membrane protein YqaA with SNARE-associated domain